MRLKKVNAVCALMTCFTGVLHIGVILYAYTKFKYMPKLIGATAGIFMTFLMIHAVLGMLSLFLKSDGTDLTLYPKQNVGTIIQRVSAALIFPLLFFHINTFSILENAGVGLFIALAALQILFYGIVLAHIGFSFGRAFITLGLIKSSKTMARVEKISLIVAAILFVAASVVVIFAEAKLFMM